ncbi:MAG: rhodanese-like domain-containing protein [Magnetococcales bacterium]|nr:rhodanese-like domain-containing protein [Magnetococcales bacterium]
MKPRFRPFLSAIVAMAFWQTAHMVEAGKAGRPLGPEVATEQMAHAKGVSIAPFTLNGVHLIQDRGKHEQADFKAPSTRVCPPFCVQPAEVAGAVTIQVEDFVRLAPEINAGKILIVDMRTPDWYAQGTLPGAINIPYTDLTGPETTARATMQRLEGKEVIGFCNGWWCSQSPTALKVMVQMKFPGKLYYFRGGSQDWHDAGLPFSIPMP